MAPEVIDSNGNVTTLCDIWSLACTIIELLTGKPPFYEKNQYQALFRIVNEQIPIPDDISEVNYFLHLIGTERFSKINAYIRILS